MFIYGLVAGFFCFLCSFILKNESTLAIPTLAINGPQDEENRMHQTSLDASTLYTTADIGEKYAASSMMDEKEDKGLCGGPSIVVS